MSIFALERLREEGENTGSPLRHRPDVEACNRRGPLYIGQRLREIAQTSAHGRQIRVISLNNILLNDISSNNIE